MGGSGSYQKNSVEEHPAFSLLVSLKINNMICLELLLFKSFFPLNCFRKKQAKVNNCFTNRKKGIDLVLRFRYSQEVETNVSKVTFTKRNI